MSLFFFLKLIIIKIDPKEICGPHVLQDEYEKLRHKIENAAQKPTPCELSGEFEAFADIERRNHPTIIKVGWPIYHKGYFFSWCLKLVPITYIYYNYNYIILLKVIWENKERLSGGLPHLIYISREKHPKHPHHYKAGAMNVLVNFFFLNF